MDRSLSYALIATIGLSASTISAAVVGDPFPVVVPAIAAGGAIAGHHIQQRDTDTQPDADGDDVLDPSHSVETDGGH